MRAKYKFVENATVYFNTSTVVAWGDIFTRELYRGIVLDIIKLSMGIMIFRNQKFYC